jgi:acetyltransferase-like isoleucine patch superfamily enzyme
MSLFDQFALRVRRGDRPFYRVLKRLRLRLSDANLPQPAILRPVFRFLFHAHFAALEFIQGAITFLYREPLFRSRCEVVGKRLKLTNIPEVYGHTRMYLGDDVTFTGKAGIASGRFIEHPKLVIGDRAIIGHNIFISVNQEIVIEADVMIANNCSISDNDGHPRAADLRAAHAPLEARDIRPVRICRSVWLGRGCQVMKGVTIGEGAIIGTNSVVITDIPAYCLAMGNPAEVIMRGAGRPRKSKAAGPVSHVPADQSRTP